MSVQLFRRLEKFRKQHGLSVLALCRELGTSNVNYYRWKERGMTGPYKKITEEFLSKNEPSLPQSFPKITSDIAVIGIACYYPGAHNVKELWENILARRVQFRRILDQRLPLKEYYNEDPKFPDTSYLTKAAFIDGFEFNWSKLRIPKKTFESTDIVHWLALDTALKTFEDAGYKPDKIPFQNTGVIVGNTLAGEQTRSLTLRLRWPYVRKTLNATLESFGVKEEERSRLSEAMEKVYKSAFFPITEDSLAGGLANTIAGRICNYLNLKGGGYIVDGACSSSLLAVATAANALKLGEMDLVLAGCVDISLDPFELVGFSKAGALAKDQMRVYDQRASGFVPGEGCGFVLLKRLDDAIRDKDYVYAVIKGWGISSDGKGGIMEPSSGGQATAIQRAYKNAGYTIADVDFIEGHGTGTAKGDRVELVGIAAALKEATKKVNGRTCGVTSFKSIVGHTKAAAGVGGFIKAALAVNQRILPPTANCQQPNEVFENEARQLYPLINGRVYSPEKVVRAGISSAGFGGINCHITIESKDDPHEKIKPSIDEQALMASNQNSEVFVFASRTIFLLRKLIQRFKEDLRNISMAEMADLSARLNKKVKANAPIKIAIVTDSPEHLYEALCAVEKELESGSLQEGQILEVKSADTITYILLGNHVKDNRIGFLYSGQGAQRLNMTRTLVERFAWARDLLKITKIPIGEYVYKPEDQFLTKEEKEEFRKELSKTEITQPAITFSSLVWTEFLSKLGVEPEVVGGHSLGELLAFYKGGAFDEKTLLRFAELRGKLMAAGSKSAGMVSLFCDYSQAEKLVGKVKGNVVISNINSPNQTVVSGGKKELEKIIELAKAENISTYLLPVSNAFHSSFMEGASKKIQSARILEEIFRPKRIGVYSCINGRRIEDKANLKEYFAKQVLSPVNFIKLVDSMSEKCDLFIEVGPGKILTDLVKAINKDKGPHCFPLEATPQNDKDLNVVLAQLFIRNVKINWQELYRNRAIKPFVPTSRKKFIENQCERPLKGVEQKELLFSKFVGPAPSGAESAQKEHPIPAQPTQSIGNVDDIAKVLIDLTHKVTGFDTQSINLNLRLLDDLNLDSIKAAELIAEAAKTLGLSGQIDPSQFSNNTLTQIRDRFSELKSQASQTIGGADNVLPRYQHNTWVRNFVVKFEEEGIKQLDSSVFKRLNKIDILSDDSQRELAYSLKQILKDKRTEARINSYDELDRTKTDPVSLICILPANHKKEPFGEVPLKRIIDRLYHVMTTAAHDGSEKEKAVVFVQFGGGNFGEDDKVNIESCCARSFASTLHLERPDLRIRVIDFDKVIPADVISKTIIEELQAPVLFSIAGYDRNLTRRVPVFHNSQPALYKKRNIQLTSKDVVLVTGGARGITAECALEFARKTKAQMVLVGRSELPETKDQDNEIIRTLNRFNEEKLKCQYYSCDVTNFESVQQLISKVEKDYGRITAVIHGAGLNTLKRLKQTNSEGAYQEALPKVLGAINICKALEKIPPKLFVGITSVIGVTGMEGSGWYGLANEILNLFLHQFKANHKETEVVTVAYSVWDDIGMGTKLGSLDWLSQRGISPIPVAQGTKRFMQLVEGDSGNQQTIVVARIAGIDTWRSPQTNFKNGFRFIEDVKYCMPGVELIAQAHLNVKNDSYVLDHNWKGTLLFPMIFGLEAMVQAACYATGTEKIQSLKFKNISLERPISVSQGSETAIEIHAEVLETDNSVKQVKVEIYCEQTNYREPHFSAILDINPSIKVFDHKAVSKENPRDPINLDLRADVYGPILFQGKMFQKLQKVNSLFYDDKRKVGKCLSEAQYSKPNLIIGDPYFIDSVLQSMQLMIPQDICLPHNIGEIELVPLYNDSEIKLAIKSSIKRIDADHYRGDAEVSGSGFTLRIRNCQLKILETLEGNPSANDLVNPATRDQKIIETKLIGLSREFGFVRPIVRCLYDERLKGARKELRHKIELPLIKAAVDELLTKNSKKISKNLRIKWDKTGRPLIIGENYKDIKISLSHDASFLMVVAGYEEQGCDVETIKERESKDWKSLLGEKNYQFYESLTKNNINKDFIGTAIWSSNECLSKISVNSRNKLYLDKSTSQAICFNIGEDNKKIIVAFKIRLSKGGDRIISMLHSKIDINKEKTNVINLLKMTGYNEEAFKLRLDYSGPQDQLVFIKSYPITFKTNKLLSKRVYFSSYFDWLGEIREQSANPIMDYLAGKFESGNWGIATYSTNLEILGELKASDILETHFWSEKIDSKIKGTYDLCIDWKKITPNEPKERVAFSRQRVIWVKVLSHGIAQVDELPEFIETFMDTMKPRIKEKKPLEKLPQTYDGLKKGKQIISFKDHAKNKYQLAEKIVNTTLENSNLVGNIYFSNYPKWLGMVMDLYFYKLIPECYQGNGEKGEFTCVNCEINHLNEAMPFDDILIRMSLDTLYEKGLDLIFYFYLVKNGEIVKKLAFAKHQVIWTRISPQNKIFECQLPDKLINEISNKV